MEDIDVIVINDMEYFEKFTNLDSLNKGPKKPLIMNRKFEVFMPDLNRFYSIFEDKQMLAFSGILSSSRPYKEYVPPFIPKINIFVCQFFIFLGNISQRNFLSHLCEFFTIKQT